jgi:DNA-binding response OmpR family regulator
MDRTEKGIWIVEDDPSIKEAIKIILEEEGYKTVTFENGEGVRKLLSFGKESPNLILLDILLGEEDGKEICKELKNKFDIPIVLMSANNFTDKDIKNSMADSYLRKPFDLNTLVRTVETFARP